MVPGWVGPSADDRCLARSAPPQSPARLLPSEAITHRVGTRPVRARQNATCLPSGDTAARKSHRPVVGTVNDTNWSVRGSY